MSDEAAKARKSSVGERRDSVSRLGSLVGLIELLVFQKQKRERKRRTRRRYFRILSVTFDGWKPTKKNVNDRC